MAHSTKLFRQVCHLRQCRRSFLAAVRQTFGEDLTLRDEKDRKPGTDEVLVRVRSAGINHADIQMINDQHQVRLDASSIPGFEFAGEVVEAGESSTEGNSDAANHKPGDRVIGLKGLTTGAFAETCVAHKSELFPIPHTMSYEVAASIPVAYGSALLALDHYAKLQKSERLLVISTQGSSGMAAVDLAANYYRAEVCVATNSQTKCDVVRPKGVMGTFDMNADGSMVDFAKRMTKGEGFDLILDTVGGSSFMDALKCIKPCGRICSMGFSSGHIPTLSVQDLTRVQASMAGVWLGGFAWQYPDRYHQLIETVIRLIDEQYIEPYIGARFKFDEINEALKAVASHEVMGKTVITLN